MSYVIPSMWNIVYEIEYRVCTKTQDNMGWDDSILYWTGGHPIFRWDDISATLEVLTSLSWTVTKVEVFGACFNVKVLSMNPKQPVSIYVCRSCSIPASYQKKIWTRSDQRERESGGQLYGDPVVGAGGLLWNTRLKVMLVCFALIHATCTLIIIFIISLSNKWLKSKIQVFFLHIEMAQADPRFDRMRRHTSYSV